MEESDRKSAIVIRRKPRRPGESCPTGQRRSGLRPLWLNGEALRIAEQCAEDAGMPVTGFVENMLFEVCGFQPPVKKSARRPKKGDAPGSGRVVPISEARRRRGMS